MSLNFLAYQGKIPKRKGALAKRNKILDAALSIIQKDGLRGVRHRAVAELAQVPLSATTYYFSDINELIIDSFVYFINQGAKSQQQLFNQIKQDVDSKVITYDDLNSLKKYFHALLLSYLIEQVSDKKSRLIERTFTQYAVRNPELAQNVIKLHKHFESQLLEILEKLNIQNSRSKAYLLMAFINLTEERALLSGELDKDELGNNIKLLLESILTL